MALVLTPEKTAYEGPVDSPIRRARLEALLEELREWGRQLGHAPVDGSLAKSGLPTVTFFLEDGRVRVAFVPSHLNLLNVTGKITISANGNLFFLCDVAPLKEEAPPEWRLFHPGNPESHLWSIETLKRLFETALNG